MIGAGIAGFVICLLIALLPPRSPVGVLLPLVVEVVALLLFLRVLLRRPARIWVLLWESTALLVLGDLVYAAYDHVLDAVPFPGWADVFYLAGYVPQAAALVLLARRRHPHRRISQVLDAAIMATPVVVLAYVLVVSPMLQSDDLSLGSLVAVAYPLADTVILVALIRLLVGGGRLNVSLALVTASVGATLLADLVYNGLVVQGSIEEQPGWVQSLFTAGVLLITMAAYAPDARSIALRDTASARRLMSPARTIALGVASLSLPLLIVLSGFGDDSARTVVLAAGAVVVNCLIVWRAFTLMGVIRRQRDELDLLARTDALTGLPNRRSWDFQLSRSQGDLDAGGGSVVLAMLDLDRFKLFNDTHGHQRGDELLRACADAWRAVLPDHAYLARYGGEEFAILLPHAQVEHGDVILEAVRAATPGPVTVSIGYARAGQGDRLSEVLGTADRALYVAKDAGRDRVVAAA